MKISCARVDQSVTGTKTEIFFQEGIIGFTANKRYTIVPEKSKDPFIWMESAEETGPSFILINPCEFMQEYAPVLSAADRRALDISGEKECVLYAIVVVPNDSDNISANLLAPLAVNVEKGIGRQVGLQDQDYSVQHLILEEMVNI